MPLALMSTFRVTVIETVLVGPVQVIMMLDDKGYGLTAMLRRNKVR